jgi:hypothetical protein
MTPDDYLGPEAAARLDIAEEKEVLRICSEQLGRKVG